MKLSDLVVGPLDKIKNHNLTYRDGSEHNRCKVCNKMMFDVKVPPHNSDLDRENSGCMNIKLWILHYQTDHEFELSILKHRQR